MSQIAFPRLDETILARRDAIVKRLAAILPPECLDRRRIPGGAPSRPTR